MTPHEAEARARELSDNCVHILQADACIDCCADALLSAAEQARWEERERCAKLAELIGQQCDHDECVCVDMAAALRQPPA